MNKEPTCTVPLVAVYKIVDGKPVRDLQHPDNRWAEIPASVLAKFLYDGLKRMGGV